jgi:FAD/FMN-containing dehydrogenase
MNRRDFLQLAVKGLGMASLTSMGFPFGTSLARTSGGLELKEKGIEVNDIHTGLNPTVVERILYPNSLNALKEAILMAGNEGKSICTAGARHAMGGQQFVTWGILIDTTTLSRVIAFDPESGTIEVEAGIQWPQVIAYLLNKQKGLSNQWGIVQKQTADWLSIGGCIGSNIHGRGLNMKPFVQDVEAFTLIDARGKEWRCSREENKELFRLAVGGYGLFGIIYSVKLRLAPRKKLECVVSIADIENLVHIYKKRIKEGFLYGSFMYNASPKSEDFLRKGILVCYRPVDTSATVPDYPKQPSQESWIKLRLLAHTDKEKYFEQLKAIYMSRSGKLYWSDTHQLGLYIKGYHRQLDNLLGSLPGSDIPTEVYVPEENLTEFIDEVRKDFIKNKVNLIFGEIGLIQKDDESFLSYAKRPWVRISLHIHTVHTPEGIKHSRHVLQQLIDRSIGYNGSYYLTNHRFATTTQLIKCYPQFPEFLRLKRKYDPEERFQSNWYRYYKEGIEI